MSYFLSILPQLIKGMAVSLQLFTLTLLGAMPLGILCAFILTSRSRVVKTFVQIYIWLMRGTPLLLQLIFVFYGLPMIGIVFDRFSAALIAFIFNYAAYFAEIFRGGIQAMPKGQYEAAQVLRLTPWQTIHKIILPQVTKMTLPAVGNEVVSLVKDTSLVYIVGLADVMRMGKIAMERDTTFIPLIGVALMYLCLTGIFTVLMKRLEQRFNYYR